MIVPLPSREGLGVRLLCIQVENALDCRRHARGRPRYCDQFAALRDYFEQRAAIGDLRIQRARVAVAQALFGGAIDDQLG